MLKLTRRNAVLACLAASCLAYAAPGLAQEDYPGKPISIVVPFPPGGTTDLVARSLADGLAKSLGQAVLVENKPGAGATLGADYVAKSRPDGYILLMGAVHHTVAPSVYKHLPYDFGKDLAPITTVAMVPNVLSVNPEKTPARSVAELVALAKKEPGRLTFGSNGIGTAQHLIGTLFQIQTGTTLLHIPYKGSAPLTTDLLGGQVNMSFDSITPVLPFIQNGKLRALAVTTGKRTSLLPDVPTLQEAGLPEFDIQTWYGIMAPAGTPQAVIDKLNAASLKIIKSDAFAKKMRAAGCETMGSTPQEFAKLIADDTKKFAKIAREGHIIAQ